MAFEVRAKAPGEWGGEWGRLLCLLALHPPQLTPPPPTFTRVTCAGPEAPQDARDGPDW